MAKRLASVETKKYKEKLKSYVPQQLNYTATHLFARIFFVKYYSEFRAQVNAIVNWSSMCAYITTTVIIINGKHTFVRTKRNIYTPI